MQWKSALGYILINIGNHDFHLQFFYTEFVLIIKGQSEALYWTYILLNLLNFTSVFTEVYFLTSTLKNRILTHFSWTNMHAFFHIPFLFYFFLFDPTYPSWRWLNFQPFQAGLLKTFDAKKWTWRPQQVFLQVSFENTWLVFNVIQNL